MHKVHVQAQEEMTEPNSDIQTFVEGVINKSFEKVQKAYDNHKEFDAKNTSVPYEDTSIVFPMYGEHITNRKTRISEQELRFAFVEAFKEENKDNKYYFSVETPTNSKYLLKGKNTPRIISKNKKGGKSGQFDLVIHNSSMKRVCLIEFKAGSPSEKEIKKDFLKLANPNEDVDEINPLRYFIHLVEKFEKNKINNRLKSANDIIDVRLNNKAVTVNYVLFSLSEDEDAIKSDLSDIIKEKSHIKYCK